MQPLAPEYLAEIARQIASLGAFLGGFSATILVTLLVATSPRRAAAWAIGAAATASVAFIVALVAATGLIITLHPEAPVNVTRDTSQITARIVAFLGFILGLYALLAAVGFSGFLRSRRAGFLTLSLAGLGAVLATWAAFGF